MTGASGSTSSSEMGALDGAEKFSVDMAGAGADCVSGSCGGATEATGREDSRLSICRNRLRRKPANFNFIVLAMIFLRRRTGNGTVLAITAPLWRGRHF